MSEKYWEFGTSSGSTAFGLVTAQKERVQGTGAVKRESTFTWLADARGNKYIGTSITTIDPGQAYAKQLKTEQGLSVEGNLLWSKAYDFAAALRTHQEFTYLTTTPYAQKFILNRQTGSTLKNGAGTVLY